MTEQANNKRTIDGSSWQRHAAAAPAVLGISRREVLNTSLAALLAGLSGGRSSWSFAAPANIETPESWQQAYQSLDRGKVRLETRVIPPDSDVGPSADRTGNAIVVISVSVESPMTLDDYVETVVILAEQSQNPELARFSFSPASTSSTRVVAQGVKRIGVSKSQKIVAVAKMNDGTLFTGRSTISLT